MGRLADGVSRQAAAAEAGAVLREMRHATQAVTYELVPAQDGVVAPVKPALLMLTVASCVRAAHRLRQRRQSPLCAIRREAARNCHPRRARLRPETAAPPPSHRERDAGPAGRCCRNAPRRGRRSTPQDARDDAGPDGSGSAAGVSAPRRDRDGRLRCGIRSRHLRDRRPVVRPGAGAATLTTRPGDRHAPRKRSDRVCRLQPAPARPHTSAAGLLSRSRWP